jgi:hypothetical protein
MPTATARQLWARRLLGRLRPHSELEANLASSSMSTSLPERAVRVWAACRGPTAARPCKDERFEYKKRMCHPQYTGLGV